MSVAREVAVVGEEIQAWARPARVARHWILVGVARLRALVGRVDARGDGAQQAANVADELGDGTDEAGQDLTLLGL